MCRISKTTRMRQLEPHFQIFNPINTQPLKKGNMNQNKNQNAVTNDDYLGEIDQRTLLNADQSVDWSSALNKKSVAVGASILGIFVLAMVLWFCFWVKPHDKAQSNNPKNQFHHQRVVVLPPQ